MLVISRKASESIFIGDDIEIIVSEIGNDKVKLCINAPREVKVMRKELLETRSLNEEASVAPTKQSLELFKDMAKALKKE